MPWATTTPSRKNGTAFATATVANVAITGSFTFTVTYAAGVKFALTVEEVTTGVTTVKTIDATNGTAFDLSGRRVAQPRRGLYIVNGKKVVRR